MYPNHSLRSVADSGSHRLRSQPGPRSTRIAPFRVLPGRVKTLVPVTIPRARRTWKLFTSDPAFGATKDEVLRLVREEVGGEENGR